MSIGCDVLLVEDDHDDVDFMKRALLEADPNTTLHVLADGQQAMSYLAQGENDSQSRLPALVITDLKMPRITGHQLIEWMRQRPRLAQIPIVVLSSSGMQQDIDRAIDQGNAHQPPATGGMIAIASPAAPVESASDSASTNATRARS